MKKLKLLLTVLLLGASTMVGAQFNRVGNSASLNMSWVNLNPKDTNSWDGIQLTNTIPLGLQSEVFNQPVRFNADLNAGYVRNGSLNSSFGSFGFGITSWFNDNFDIAVAGIAPYFRLGLSGNSGSIGEPTNNYMSYQIEPGLVVKIDSFYGLISYNYGNDFGSDQSNKVQSIGMGIGLNLTKSLAVETRYDLGYGSYDANKLVVGGVYKF